MPNDKITAVGANIAEKAAMIWNVADMLRGPFKPHEYGLVILPMTVVKRFHDCLLPTHQAVLDTYEKVKKLQVIDGFLQKASGYQFYNTSRFTFETLLADPDNIESNFRDYLSGFSANAQDVSTLFTYDMLRDIWVPLLSGIIGGLFTLIGVILTIKHERKKDISEHLQEIKPYLVIVHPSEVKRSEWNSQRYIYMLDDENDFDEDDVSTPLYRWDYLCLSNIGSSIGILKYIKVNEDIYSFDENSAIRPDECYQIHGSRLTNFTSGHVNSIHLGLYDKCFNFYEYNISFSIKELAPRDHPRENEKLLHFDTIDCVHNLYRPKQSFIGSFFHHRF